MGWGGVGLGRAWQGLGEDSRQGRAKAGYDITEQGFTVQNICPVSPN